MRFSMTGLARSNQSVSAGTAPGTRSKHSPLHWVPYKQYCHYNMLTYLAGCQTIDKVGRFCLPIKSANIDLSPVMQKSADFIVQHRTRSILDDEIDQIFGHSSLWWLFAVGDEYLF